MKPRKVMIIGTGNVGAPAAYALLNKPANRQRTDSGGHQSDAARRPAQRSGRCGGLCMQSRVTVSSRSAADCADVDIAVISVSGGSLKLGQTRLDELDVTAGIVSGRFCRK